MTEEEYFRKYYPDYCYGDRLLSPYWDLFQDGVEFGERQSEQKIADLEKENAELKKKCYKKAVKDYCKLEQENAELKEQNKNYEQLIDNGSVTLAKERLKNYKQLTKAKEIILKLYNAGRNVLMCRAEEKAYDNLSNAINDRSIEKFLKEIEE